VSLPSIGYHYVILANGVVATGRHVDEIGAHVQGFNRASIGICMVGTDAFSTEQWRALRRLVDALRMTYPAARVVGHRDLSPDRDGDGKVERSEWTKTCPGFDVASWLVGAMVPLSGNICEEKR
jgi:N-acetyl-anhydromuramyl-L-alanine amidase AmpD